MIFVGPFMLVVLAVFMMNTANTTSIQNDTWPSCTEVLAINLRKLPADQAATHVALCRLLNLHDV